MKRDVVVIGGGMAGVAAALAATSRGARVTLIRRAHGATALCMGGWSGPLPAQLGRHFEQVDHPWIEVTEPLPASIGSVIRFDRAAPAQAAARLQARTLVAGITGLPSFQPGVLAAMWSDITGTELIPLTIRLEDTPPAGWSPASLAATIARDSTRLGRALEGHVRAQRATSVVLPAVLGLEPDDGTRQTIESITGVPVGEVLADTPSIPGLRLRVALDRLLQRANVDVKPGTVTMDTSQTKGHLRSVLVQYDGQKMQLEAHAFILATGRFIGGGIRADGVLREDALGFPVCIEHAGEVFERAEPLALTNADRRETQPLLAAGVSVDAEGRPAAQDGVALLQNVWAAGAVRRSHEPDAQGLGHAAVEGWAAGERATA